MYKIQSKNVCGRGGSIPCPGGKGLAPSGQILLENGRIDKVSHQTYQSMAFPRGESIEILTQNSTAMGLTVFAENPSMRQPKLPASPARHWLGRPSIRNWPLKMGQAIGKECNAKGVALLLGPTVNLHRSPLGMCLSFGN